MSDQTVSVAELTAQVVAFSDARDWARFHRPGELAKALSVEAGELLQLFLWVDPNTEGGRPEPSHHRLEEEVADVAMCLLNLCHRAGIDLSGAVARKLELNALKYPVAQVKGQARKYDEYGPEDAGSSTLTAAAVPATAVPAIAATDADAALPPADVPRSGA